LSLAATAGQPVDLLVVGGGINGAGIARDAAGRGLSVVLVEKDDLASHTSSAISKLVHGGLRYLEQLDLRLVRESLAERERLMRIAPHLVRPLRFVIPVRHGSRPAWMIRLGLFVYDHLARRRVLPASGRADLAGTPLGAALRAGGGPAFAYWDCLADDSRLVIANALGAAERDAAILTRTELVCARRDGSAWLATVRDRSGERTIAARALVNAAGPWAGELIGRLAGVDSRPRLRLRLVKGSHILLPRLHGGDDAVLLQNPDRRVVFAIPYRARFTLVGTTDVDWQGPPGPAAIGEDEADYLLATVARHFRAAPARAEIAWSYAGVRALADDGASDASLVTRDHSFDLDAPAGAAPVLSLVGGKITTYRRVAEQALDRLARAFPSAGGPWTAAAPLPGGDIADLAAFRSGLARRYPFLPAALADRLANCYGTGAGAILAGARGLPDLGAHFGAGLYEREIDYLVRSEWARSAEDILFRRTKLGLDLGPDAAGAIDDHVAALCR